MAGWRGTNLKAPRQKSSKPLSLAPLPLPARAPGPPQPRHSEFEPFHTQSIDAAPMEVGATAESEALDVRSLFGAVLELCRQPPRSQEAEQEEGKTAAVSKPRSLLRNDSAAFVNSLTSASVEAVESASWRLATLAASDDAVALALVRIANSAPSGAGFALTTVAALRALGRVSVLNLSAGPLALVALSRLEDAARGLFFEDSSGSSSSSSLGVS